MPLPRPVLLADRIGSVADWPVHDTAATRLIETLAANALPAHALMQRAGLAVSRLALALAPHAQRIQVWCGPGNNGGDGLLAAAHLHRAGKSVEVKLIASCEALPPDAAAALQVARGAGVRIAAAADANAGSAPIDLTIDALFGMGLKRAPDGAARAAIMALRSEAAPVLSIDLPSGLSADHGTAFDAVAAVQARWTLSLLTLKPGLFTAAGRDHAGDVWFDDLGVSGPAPNDTPPTCLLITDSTSLWPPRRHVQHKGSFGDVWVVGGAAGMRGAAWLAARAALAAGAGRVMVVPADGSSTADHDPLHPESMLRPLAALSAHDTPLETSTVVAGCGAGEGAAWRTVLASLIARAGRLLLDADAINALAADRSMACGLVTRARRGRATVMTPHPLEAARWLGNDVAAVQADRLGSARRMARETCSHVVLKGSGTIGAAPDGGAWINASGNAALAGAGTGDALAGWIGGLWSQGLSTAQSVRLGVHSHGAAADRWRARVGPAAPLEASRLIELLRDRA